MKKLLPLLIISFTILVAGTLAGCGQKGPLVPPPAAEFSQ